MSTPVPPARAAGPSALLVAVLALLSAIGPIAIDMYLPAFPRIATDLHTDAAQVQLTLTTFMVGLAVGQLVIGPISDRWGRRTPLLVGAAVCTAAGALCALAPSVEALILLRFVQGFSGSAGVVVGRAVVSDVASGPVAARVFSVLMTIVGVAPVVAPLAGGAMIDAIGWRGVFWVLTAASLLMFLGALFVVGETLPRERRHGGGLAATARAARTVLTDRVYVGYALCVVFGFGTLFAYVSASPFVVQNVFGLSTTHYSVVFAVNALGLTVANAVNARLVDRIAPQRLVPVGLSVMLGVAVLLCALALVGHLARPVALVLLFLSMASLGLVFANASTLAIDRAPHAAGTASAVMGALQFGIGAVVSPLVGLGGEHTAVPMALTMAASAVCSVLCYLLTRGERRDATPDGDGTPLGATADKAAAVPA